MFLSYFFKIENKHQILRGVKVHLLLTISQAYGGDELALATEA